MGRIPDASSGARRRYALILVLLLVSAAAVMAQFGRQRFPRAALATADSFTGDWHFCRLAYQGRAWATDYPDADYNFSTRISELTKARVGRDGAGQVAPLIVRPSDPALFKCPFVMMWQAESLHFSDEDAARLREYLLKGGFLWADDFWGSWGWDNFADEISRVLPRSTYDFVDVPPDHSILRTLFDVPRVPQVPGISFWWGTGGRTSEQGADSAQVNVRAITDERGRIMVLATHNTDIADGWEREGVDPRYFYEFSRESYAVGVNILMYAMTH